MSVTNHVAERNRTYVRRFDHEEAARRRAAGERVADLAAEYGVSESAIYLVTTPGAKTRNVENGRRWRTTTCEVCGEPAMRVVGTKRRTARDGRALCVRCRADERRERLAFDETGRLVAVRCTQLDCANDERWQPPENFTRGLRHREVREGGIHGLCRSCQTRTKRRYRQQHAEYRRRNGGSGRRGLHPEAMQTRASAE